jgi:hypothetical protein
MRLSPDMILNSITNVGLSLTRRVRRQRIRSLLDLVSFMILPRVRHSVTVLDQHILWASVRSSKTLRMLQQQHKGVLIVCKCLTGVACRFVHLVIDGPAHLVAGAVLSILQVLAEENTLDEVLLSLAAEPMVLSHAIRRMQDVILARKTGLPPGLTDPLQA